ncbi:unnamed protein product, partial [Rotaria sp. Silwood1]
RQDANDSLNEWYSIMGHSIFDPNYALFMKNINDNITYRPNHLEYFKFIGHIIGKAIYDNKYMNCYFTRPFYKYILDMLINIIQIWN